MDELVTIIISTYGGKECIKNAVQSCIVQSYPNIEIIVVDDNGLGTENQIRTKEYLKEYIERGDIQYIPHLKNANASVARNTGFNHSNGVFIALLDDDDTYCVDKIKEQVNAFKELSNDYGLVYCSFVDHIEDGRNFLYQATADGDLLFDFLMMRVGICTSNLMIRRSCYVALQGFDESFIRHQDWEFLARAAAMYKIKGISYVGMEKRTKRVEKRFTAVKAEEFRKRYWEVVREVSLKLSAQKRKQVFAHEYNEVAKLFFREKNFKTASHYMLKSGRPQDFIGALLFKPIKEIKSGMKGRNDDYCRIIRS